MGKTLDVIRRAGLAGLIASLVGMAGVASATDYEEEEPYITRYTGRATVIDARVKLLTSNTKLVVADTGELDFSGATRDATVLTFDNDPPLEIHSKTLHAIVSGMNNTSSATAAVEKLEVKIGSLHIQADLIEANAIAVCRPDSQTVHPSGNSHLVNLRINGQGREASPPPNTKIEIPNVATIILNEQREVDWNTIEVTAIHIIVPGNPSVGNADVAISRARAGIFTCADRCQYQKKQYW